MNAKLLSIQQIAEKIDYDEIKYLQKELRRRKEKLHEGEEKNKKLNIKLTDYKKRYETLIKINIELQTKIISFFDHAEGTDQRLSI